MAQENDIATNLSNESNRKLQRDSNFYQISFQKLKRLASKSIFKLKKQSKLKN